MTNNLEDEIRAICSTYGEPGKSQDNHRSPQEEIQDVYVLIVREQEEDQTQVVDSRPLVPHNRTTLQQDSFLSAYCLCVSHCFLFFPHLRFNVLHDEPAQ